MVGKGRKLIFNAMNGHFLGEDHSSNYVPIALSLWNSQGLCRDVTWWTIACKIAKFKYLLCDFYEVIIAENDGKQ